jgi:hypothetical protein
MTLRVYTMTRGGVVVDERAEVHVVDGDVLPPLMSHTYPPCECPRHRPQKEVKDVSGQES